MRDQADQEKLLAAVEEVFSRWQERFSFACKAGCADCCTMSATATGLEARRVLRFLEEQGGAPAEIPPSAESHPSFTTNGFVARHLNRTSADEADAAWDMRPCPFLDHAGRCSIYQVRPLACRVFASLAPCCETGAADLPPVYLTGATIMLQVVEQLDCGGPWGVFLEVLAHEQGERSGQKLLRCQPVPGFVVEPQERGIIAPLIRELMAIELEGAPLLSLQSMEDYCQAKETR